MNSTVVIVVRACAHDRVPVWGGAQRYRNRGAHCTKVRSPVMEVNPFEMPEHWLFHDLDELGATWE